MRPLINYWTHSKEEPPNQGKGFINFGSTKRSIIVVTLVCFGFYLYLRVRNRMAMGVPKKDKRFVFDCGRVKPKRKLFLIRNFYEAIVAEECEFDFDRFGFVVGDKFIPMEKTALDLKSRIANDSETKKSELETALEQ